MKRQQKFITALSLIVALSGLSPMVAADAGGTLEGGPTQPQHKTDEVTTREALKVNGNEKREKLILTSAEMDGVKGGFWWVLVRSAIVFIATRGDHH
jgi:hypothetical protein